MRRILCIGAVLLIVCGLSGCGGSNKPQDLIVGKWEMKDKGADGKEITGTAEFIKDGTMKMAVLGFTVEGKYKFIDDKEIEVTMGGKTQKNKIDSITKDKMVIIFEGGKKTEFTKIK